MLANRYWSVLRYLQCMSTHTLQALSHGRSHVLACDLAFRNTSRPVGGLALVESSGIAFCAGAQKIRGTVAILQGFSFGQTGCGDFS